MASEGYAIEQYIDERYRELIASAVIVSPLSVSSPNCSSTSRRTNAFVVTFCAGTIHYCDYRITTGVTFYADMFLRSSGM